MGQILLADEPNKKSIALYFRQPGTKCTLKQNYSPESSVSAIFAEAFFEAISSNLIASVSFEALSPQYRNYRESKRRSK